MMKILFVTISFCIYFVMSFFGYSDTTKNVKVFESVSIYSQSDIDNNFKNTDEVIIDKMEIKKSGTYDFYNINFSYSGKDKGCKKSRKGFVPFIIIGGQPKTGYQMNINVHIKNLIVKKSAPDGIEIQKYNIAKFTNLKLLHSCDEGFEVRPNAKIELINSKIVSQYNKGISFKRYNQARIIDSEIISEQALSIQDGSLDVTIENSIIKKHPLSRFGRLLTGDKCSYVKISRTNTQFIGLEQLFGAESCTNIKMINY